RENTRIDHDTANTGWYFQRAVTYVSGFLTKDSAEQLFFRRKLSLSFRCDLSNEDIPGIDLSTNTDDARIIQVFKSFLTYVRNVFGDLFFAKLCVAGNAFELLDMNGSVHVFFNDTLTDQNRVFKVVPLPRHERDQHVLSQSKLTTIDGRTISKNVACLNYLARAHRGLLCVTSALITTLVLGEMVNIRNAT